MNKNAAGIAALSALLITILLSISYGAGSYTLADFIRYFGGETTSSSMQPLADVFWQARLPRTLAGMIVGGGLALSATLLQTVTRNPLAEPGLLGVNAGAVLGLTIGISYFSASSIHSFMAWAGGGAMGAITLVLFVAGIAKRSSPPHLILIGIATSATLGGLANYILMSFSAALEQFRFWNLGSLSGIKMEAVENVAPYVFASCLVIALMTRGLTLLQLGEDKAKTMGVSVPTIMLSVWLTTALLTACAIAIAGPVMFVGFLAAFLARLMSGTRLGLQLIYSFVLGVILILASDLCARLIIQPYEVPVGVIIALIGTPLTILVSKTKMFRTALVRE